MPAPKRSSSASRKSSSTAKPAAKQAGSTASESPSAARSGAKSSATSTRKAAGRTATQAKSAATKTARTAKSGAAKTSRSSRAGGAGSTARAAGSAAASTAKSARSGARGTAKAARAGASQVKSTAKAGATRTRRATRGSEGAAEQLSKGAAKPRNLVMLTRDRIQETLDDAASRGRVTRKDANELVSELVRRALQQSDEMMHELEQLLDRGLGQLESATKLARKSDSVDRLVRGADRARRTVGVGPTFPILAYDDLNGGQIQSRLGDLTRPELRKVLTYERNHANRKTVVAALEKAIG